MQFFVGLHHPADAWHFDRTCISVNCLRGRRSNFPVRQWLLDSGAFSTLAQHGRYLEPPEAYAEVIARWAKCGDLLAAVTQDYMCESAMLARTGLTVTAHQALTIDRTDVLRRIVRGVYVMPVLQGYAPAEYADHVRQYGPRLGDGAWVGVGSVCKRNARPEAILAVLHAILQVRPDLQLHGFGLKRTALAAGPIRRCLYSADSMAWSFAARRQGRNANHWSEAAQFAAHIAEAQTRPSEPMQVPLL